MHPPPSHAWANFSIMMECMPESGLCHSVCTLCLNLQNINSAHFQALLKDCSKMGTARGKGMYSIKDKISLGPLWVLCVGWVGYGGQVALNKGADGRVGINVT